MSVNCWVCAQQFISLNFQVSPVLFDLEVINFITRLIFLFFSFLS